MKNKILACTAILAITILAWSCKKEPANERPVFTLEQSDNIPAEDYEIYSLLINEHYSPNRIVVAQESEKYPTLNYTSPYYQSMVDEYPGLDTTLIQQYITINDATVLFAENFVSTNKQVDLISQAELNYIFNRSEGNDGWSEFYQYYEGSSGYMHFSRIGYNADHTQAVFEISHWFGVLGGEGSIVYAVKENGLWKIKGMIPTWIS